MNELLKKILPVIRTIFLNKYIITIIIALILVTFVSEHNLKSRWNSSQDIKKLKNEIEFYQGEIDKNNQKMNDMQASDESLEKYARENYYLKKQNEDIYIVKEDE